jgi:hypothetical protein
MWLDPERILASRQAVERLTPEGRAALTWEGAARFVLSDTVELAQWARLKRRPDLTPWQALAMLKGITEGGLEH